jgi:multidrug transporter EmrE-like cation transporter
MRADPTGLAFLLAAVSVESLAQMALKVGASGPGILSAPMRRLAGAGRLLESARSWVALGVVLYLVEIGLYSVALSRLPVSVAFPIGSLCFVGGAVLARIVLGEAVGPVRWVGVLLILGGAALMTS